MINILSVHNPRWSSADHTSIDFDLLTDHGEMPTTSVLGDELFTRATADPPEFGEIAEFVAPPPPFSREFVDIERVRRVTDAYGGFEKRISLSEYMAQLNTQKAAGTITDDQLADLNLLLAAAQWQQQMLDAVDPIMVDGVMTDASWPVFEQADALAALAALS
jgi:hypothetical protein